MTSSTAPDTAFFDGDWLAERESADHAARARSLNERLAAWVGHRIEERQGDRWSLVDLGSGTGSNVRYLASELPSGQRWTLVDHDATHLESAERCCNGLPGVASVVVRHQSIGQGLDWVIPDQTDLVTASALLDLMSSDWIETLVNRTVACKAAGLFALSYSGAFEITPGHDDDVWIQHVVNQHQQTAKGTGVALGPAAWQACARQFEAAGYRVWCEASDWMLGPVSQALQGQLIQGWAQAAADLMPNERQRVERWCQSRLANVGAGSVRIRVSHKDVLVLPECVTGNKSL